METKDEAPEAQGAVEEIEAEMVDAEDEVHENQTIPTDMC